MRTVGGGGMVHPLLLPPAHLRLPIAAMSGRKLASVTPGSRRSRSMAGWLTMVSEAGTAGPLLLLAPGGRPTSTAAAASGSSWLRLSSRKMSAVAWGLRDHTVGVAIAQEEGACLGRSKIGSLGCQVAMGFISLESGVLMM